MAAYTLQQRYNYRRGLPLTDAVTELSKLEEAIYKLGADVVNEQLTINTEINGGTVFTMASKNVSSAQLNEWAMRSLNGTMQTKMFSVVLDEGTFPAADTDTKIINVARRVIWTLAKQIGGGSF
jgi:hypothetical protein